MDNTTSRETKTTKKMFDYILKEGPVVLLDKMGYGDFKFASIENKWNEKDDHKAIIYNLVKEIKKETAGLYIDIKHGKPTTEQVFDAVYGRGAKCKIRIIMYDGQTSEEDKVNPTACEYMVENLLKTMNAYPLNLYLKKIDGEDLYGAIDDMDNFEKPVPEYSIEDLPSPEEFRHSEFWYVYFWLLDKFGLYPGNEFLEGLRHTPKWQFPLFTKRVAEIPLKWDSDGIKYVVKQTGESVYYLQKIWLSKQDELNKRYNGRVEFEYLPGKLSIIKIQYSDRPINWLVTATSQEKCEFAVQLDDDFYSFLHYLDKAAEEI